MSNSKYPTPEQALTYSQIMGAKYCQTCKREIYPEIHDGGNVYIHDDVTHADGFDSQLVDACPLGAKTHLMLAHLEGAGFNVSNIQITSGGESIPLEQLVGRSLRPDRTTPEGAMAVMFKQGVTLTSDERQTLAESLWTRIRNTWASSSKVVNTAHRALCIVKSMEHMDVDQEIALVTLIKLSEDL